jgi:hypothetical protein
MLKATKCLNGGINPRFLTLSCIPGNDRLKLGFTPVYLDSEAWNVSTGCKRSRCLSFTHNTPQMTNTDLADWLDNMNITPIKAAALLGVERKLFLLWLGGIREIPLGVAYACSALINGLEPYGTVQSCPIHGPPTGFKQRFLNEAGGNPYMWITSLGLPKHIVSAVMRSGDDYVPQKRTVMRLAQATGKSVPWWLTGSLEE